MTLKHVALCSLTSLQCPFHEDRTLSGWHSDDSIWATQMKGQDGRLSGFVKRDIQDVAILRHCYLGNGNSLNMFCWNMDFGMFSMLHSSIKLVKYLKYIMWCRVDSHREVAVK